MEKLMCDNPVIELGLPLYYFCHLLTFGIEKSTLGRLTYNFDVLLCFR